MNIENSKTFQPSEVTEALRDQYESLSLTDEQARAILANVNTLFVMKLNQLDADPGGAHD